MDAFVKGIIENAFKAVMITQIYKRDSFKDEYKSFIKDMKPEMREIVNLWEKTKNEMNKKFKG